MRRDNTSMANDSTIMGIYLWRTCFLWNDRGPHLHHATFRQSILQSY